jgi:hypothetical protein
MKRHRITNLRLREIRPVQRSRSRECGGLRFGHPEAVRRGSVRIHPAALVADYDVLFDPAARAVHRACLEHARTVRSDPDELRVVAADAPELIGARTPVTAAPSQARPSPAITLMGGP